MGSPSTFGFFLRRRHLGSPPEVTMYVAFFTTSTVVTSFSHVLVSYLRGRLFATPEQMARHLLVLRRVCDLVSAMVAVQKGGES